MRSKRLAQGIKLRSRLFGDDYTQSSLTRGDPLNREVQELITEYGYGAVWSRPGLPLAARSMLTLALLAALNRPEQLRAHLDGARNAGLTRREIVEIFVHVILYCGAPAGLAAVKIAMEAFRIWDEGAASEASVRSRGRKSASRTTAHGARRKAALRKNKVRR